MLHVLLDRIVDDLCSFLSIRLRPFPDKFRLALGRFLLSSTVLASFITFSG